MSDVLPLVDSWARSLRAKNRSPRTIKAYVESAGLFLEFLQAQGKPLELVEITRANIEEFISDQLDRWTPSTAATRYRCLQQFVRFLVDEEEIPKDPMRGMSPPKIGDVPVPVFTDDELRRLLGVAEKGRDFASRRDAALLRVFIDTGARLGEVAGMAVENVYLDGPMILVTGKGDRGRWLPLGDKATAAVDRYLRKRRAHRLAEHPALWLGVRGPLTDSGITQTLKRVAREAGVEGMHPHRFRHTMAHRWLAEGGQEGDLQQLAGWRSPQMIGRYGASAKAERARQAHRRLALGDLI